MIRKNEYIVPTVKVVWFKAEQGFAVSKFYMNQNIGQEGGEPGDGSFTAATLSSGGNGNFSGNVGDAESAFF